MPIEIKELVIKTTIDNSGAAGGAAPMNDKQMQRYLKQMKEKIVEECLRKIQDQLERDFDR